MQNTLQTTGTSMPLNLEEAMRIKITRKDIPDYTIPLLSAWLSEGTHGIAYTGDVSAYLRQVAEKYALSLPKLYQIDTAWVEKLNKTKSLEVLLAFFEKEMEDLGASTSIFDAYMNFNLIKNRSHFSPNAELIKRVICIHGFKSALTSFICAANGYEVTFYREKLVSFYKNNDDFDKASGQEPYIEYIKWGFLLFPQVSIKKSFSFWDSDNADANLENLLLSESYDYSSTALVGFRINSDKVKNHFSVFITDGFDVKNNIDFFMTQDKKTFVKSAVLLSETSGEEQIYLFDYEHPSTEVLMSNLVNYENTAGEMASFTELLTDEDYTTKVSTTEIIANKYNFSVSYYAKDTSAKTWLKSLKQFDVVDLSDVVTFHRPPTIKALKDEADSETFYEIALSDINEFSRIDQPKKEVLVNASDALRTKNEGLEKGDIIFAIKGDIGRVGLFSGFFLDINNSMMGKAFIGLRLKPKYLLQGMTPEYLVAYLADENVKNYIRHLNTGAKVENIRMDDLKSIPVIVDKQFIEKTQFTIEALETQRQSIELEQSVYKQLKYGLSHSITGSREYLKEMPIRD